MSKVMFLHGGVTLQIHMGVTLQKTRIAMETQPIVEFSLLC